MSEEAMKDDDSTGSHRKLPFTRKEDYRKEILGAVLGIIGAVFISGSGVLRWGKHTSDDDKRAMSELKMYVDKTFYSRDAINGKFERFKESFEEKNLVCKGDVTALQNNEIEIRKDIRSINNTLAKLPPPKLVNRVTSNEFRILHLEEEQQILIRSQRNGAANHK